MDEERNLLLEIRGSKTITIVDGTQEFAVVASGREVFFADDGELHPGRVDDGGVARRTRSHPTDRRSDPQAAAP